MAIFRSNPEYVKVMEYAPKFITHRIIIEVVEAHNCIARHKAGERIAVSLYLDSLCAFRFL